MIEEYLNHSQAFIVLTKRKTSSVETLVDGKGQPYRGLMKRISSWSLRGRMLAAVIVAILPVLGLTLHNGFEDRRLEAKHAANESLRLAQLAATAQERLIGAARQLLFGLAHLPLLQEGDPARCNALLASLAKQFPEYDNIAIAWPDGTVFASAQSLKKHVNVANRLWFERTMHTRQFAVGDYHIGQIVGLPVVVCAQPVFDDAGQIESLVFASVDLIWISRLVTELRLPAGSTLSVVDANGMVLASNSEPEKWVGKLTPEASVIKTMQAQREGFTEQAGSDGVNRLYAFTPLPGESAFVSIGIPTTAVYAMADRILTRNLIAVAIVGVLALAAAWAFSEWSILRRTRRLMTATRRLSEGDLSARTGVSYGGGELGQLARSFDDMAESLQQRTAELKTALRELDARRRQEIEMQEEFLSKISHELRTPLAVIHQCASILADGLGGEISLRQREFVQTALANVTHLQSMIEELLDAASSQNGKLAIRPGRVAMPGLVQEVLKHYQYTAQRSGLALSMEIANDLPTALADARRVRQILANLIENSLKFTQGPGTVTVRASVSEQDSHFLQIVISDTGCGMDPAERERVFDRHYQIAGSVSTSRTGLGLGLYICRELVALHGGRIWIDSHRGQGCMVTFTLPIFESDKIPSADMTK